RPLDERELLGEVDLVVHERTYSSVVVELARLATMALADPGSRHTDRRARARSRPAGRRGSPPGTGSPPRMTAGAAPAADPPQRPVLFVNPRSGAGKAT